MARHQNKVHVIYRNEIAEAYVKQFREVGQPQFGSAIGAESVASERKEDKKDFTLHQREIYVRVVGDLMPLANHTKSVVNDDGYTAVRKNYNMGIITR